MNFPTVAFNLDRSHFSPKPTEPRDAERATLIYIYFFWAKLLEQRLKPFTATHSYCNQLKIFQTGSVPNGFVQPECRNICDTNKVYKEQLSRNKVQNYFSKEENKKRGKIINQKGNNKVHKSVTVKAALDRLCQSTDSPAAMIQQLSLHLCKTAAALHSLLPSVH